MRLKAKLRILLAGLAAVVMTMPLPSYAARKITTPTSEVSKKTDLDEYTVTVNSDKGTRDYRIFYQGGEEYKKGTYIPLHGCATSSLTTVLSGYSKVYGNYTPVKTYTSLEKKALGTRIWTANYRKTVMKQMPISLNGISKVLRYAGIKNHYVRFFKDKNAVAAIKAHLYKGKPVVIETNNHRQTNGRFLRAYNRRWANSKHTMVLLGITDTGKVMVADSANRDWSGTKQRIKFSTVETLVHYMIPCKTSSSSCYFTSVNSSGGYILVG